MCQQDPEAYVIPQSQRASPSPAKQGESEDSGVEEEMKAIAAKPKHEHAIAKEEETPDESNEFMGEEKKRSARKSKAKAKPTKTVDRSDNNDNLTLTAKSEAAAVDHPANQVVSQSEEHPKPKAVGHCN